MLAILDALPSLTKDFQFQLLGHPGDGALKVIEQPAVVSPHVVRGIVRGSVPHRLHGVLGDEPIQLVYFIHHTNILAEPLMSLKLLLEKSFVGFG